MYETEGLTAMSLIHIPKFAQPILEAISFFEKFF